MTAQAREIIYINGEEEQMAAEPLSPFLLANPKIQFTAPTTACWRGYYGIWELADDKLYLRELSGYIKTPEDYYKEVDLHYLFPGQEKVFAEWFTGIIKIEQGTSYSM